jgi:hypothetical protein
MRLLENLIKSKKEEKVEVFLKKSKDKVRNIKSFYEKKKNETSKAKIERNKILIYSLKIEFRNQ